MKFFFYADNLNLSQLKRRAPEHKFLFTAYLPDHSIQFCRWSTQWRCGLASVVPSPGEKVWGAVFEITDEDLKILDDFEDDVPQGAYRHLPVSVVRAEDEKSSSPPMRQIHRQIQAQGTLHRLGRKRTQAVEIAGRIHRAMASL